MTEFDNFFTVLLEGLFFFFKLNTANWFDERKYSAEQHKAGLSVTPPRPPLTSLDLTLLKGRRVQAGCAHLPGAKRVCAHGLHAQAGPDTRANAWAQWTWEMLWVSVIFGGKTSEGLGARGFIPLSTGLKNNVAASNDSTMHHYVQCKPCSLIINEGIIK